VRCADAVSFDATLVDYYTTDFQPGTDVYTSYIAAVAAAAYVTSPDVTITAINPGSVVVSTTVATQSSMASAFAEELTSGNVFGSSFGDVTVSSIQVESVQGSPAYQTPGAGMSWTLSSMSFACLDMTAQTKSPHQTSLPIVTQIDTWISFNNMLPSQDLSASCFSCADCHLLLCACSGAAGSSLAVFVTIISIASLLAAL